MQKLILLLALAFFWGNNLPCQNPKINLLAHTYLKDSVGGTDVWGYVDGQGNEYALAGSWSSTHIWNVSNPSAPVQAAVLDTIDGFDIKTYDTLMYTVAGNQSSPGYITSIKDPSNPVTLSSFPGAHNIWITDNGYLIASGPGLTIYNLNPNPLNPVQVFIDTSLGGHDAYVINNKLYYFGGFGGTYIYNFDNPSNPQLIGQINDPAIVYHHSGWTTSDGKYLYILDELAKHPTPDITVWDISNPSNPSKVQSIGDSTAIVHNMFVIGNYAYTSYYMEGFKIFDVSNPPLTNLAAQFITFPDSSKEDFNGNFGVYPYSPSGVIYLNDMTYGLFLVEFDTVQVGIEDVQTTSISVYPNPSDGNFNLSYEGKWIHQILSSDGKKIHSWKDSVGGRHQRNTDISGLSPGIYLWTLGSGSKRESRKIVIH